MLKLLSRADKPWIPPDRINLFYLYEPPHLHQSYLLEPSTRTPETEGAQSKFAKIKL